MNINSSLIFDKLSDEIKHFIDNIIKESNKYNIDVYVVGGYIRDYILSVYSSDIDLVFVGDTNKILHYIDLNFTNYEYSDAFKTIKITINSYEIDLVTARKELYYSPGALPVITSSNIIDDLNRRDFTINSMALKLNNLSLTPVIDLNLSKRDLGSKWIRVHHNYSFVDDPTRIFRAFRYAARYSFTIEEHTKDLIEEEVDRRKLTNISNIRIMNEATKDFKEQNYKAILDFYKSYGIYDIIFSDSFSRKYILDIHDKFLKSKLKGIPYSGVNLYKTSMTILEEEKLIMILILVCISLSSEENFNEYAQNLNKRVKKISIKISRLLKALYSLDNFQVYKHMDKLSLEERHILLYFVDDIIFSEILNTQILGVNTKPHIHIDDILNMGIDKSYIGEILDDIHHYKFERGISSLSGTPLTDLSANASLSNTNDLNYLKIVIERKKNYYFNTRG